MLKGEGTTLVLAGWIWEVIQMAKQYQDFSLVGTPLKPRESSTKEER